jgi:hypothetical protein
MRFSGLALHPVRMGPFALLVLLLGLDRLLGRERGGALARPARLWRQARPRALAYLRSAPVTCAYLFVLVVTTWVLATSSNRVANRLLLERSTNLHQLGRDPVRVLVASAFWLPSTWQLALWAAAMLVVIAPLERRIGAGRTVAVLVAGHVGATLLTAAGLWLAVRSDAVEHSVVDAKDVGASYAVLAAAAALAYVLDRPLRVPYGAALVALGVGVVSVSPDFTNFGHLLSILVGLGCYPVVAGAVPGLPPIRLPERPRRRRPRDSAEAAPRGAGAPPG